MDFDFDAIQFIETEKYDAKPTYKKFLGYSLGVAVINYIVLEIQATQTYALKAKETLERIFKCIEASNIDRRMDCGSCSE